MEAVGQAVADRDYDKCQDGCEGQAKHHRASQGLPEFGAARKIQQERE